MPFHGEITVKAIEKYFNFLLVLTAAFLLLQVPLFAQADPTPPASASITATFAATGTSQMTLPTSSIGSTFTVDVAVSNVQNVNNVWIQLGWNPAVVSLQSVTEDSSFLGTNPPSTTHFTGNNPNNWDNQTGSVWIIEGRNNLTVTNNAEGAICHLTFKVENVGTADIAFIYAIAFDPTNQDTQLTAVNANLNVTDTFVAPEYPFAALLVLISCFAAFAIFKASKSSLPAFRLKKA
jgi:hypothetical protein